MTLTLSGYSITEQIHEGVRSRVYRGARRSDGKPVVIKVHRRDPPSSLELGQYRNQYAITRSLDVPGVARPLALESHGHGHALIFEDTGAISLRSHARRSPLGPAEVLELAVQIARVLEGLHARRVIHKDVKPDSIIIHPESKAVSLIDFSIASLLPRESLELQRSPGLEGSLAYISPEQTGRMNRHVDHRSDHYSFGVTLYEMLTGQLPFTSSDPMELIHAHIARRPTPPAEINPAIPAALSEIVVKLLAKAAEARYQSAAGLRHDLETCLEEVRATGTAAPFPLGKRDVPQMFLVPEKLYGREAEVELLLAAFDRVSQGATELMLVAGSSGIGKSALVQEVHKPIVSRRGHFVAGKFDQLSRDIPFSSLVQAFRDLIRQVLTEPGDRVEAWRAKLLAALGSQGRVVTEVIPEVAQLIGDQPPLPALPPADAQERFNQIFQKFIRVFADEKHPLVLFLDDLQWADFASLRLVELLMADADADAGAGAGAGQKTPYLLLLGAYRDNEVGPTHALALMLDRLRQGGATVTRIGLEPLDAEHLGLLVADTLKQPKEQAVGLADMVMRRTQGNPFFSSQLLTSLHQEGLIAFDAATGGFRYELSLPTARQAASRSDVVELVADQIRTLPESTQSALRLAAAIGNRFDLATLSVARERSQIDTAADLWPALLKGLVLPLDDAYRAFPQRGPGDEAEIEPAQASVSYRFLHDRVQQAAYLLIPVADRPATHLRIGRLLLKGVPPGERDERIFELVNHLDLGAALIEDPRERAEVAELNLIAGRRAKASTAHASAARYLAAGMALLGPDCWTAQAELTAALHRERAEVEYLEGDFDLAEELVRAAIAHARTPVEKAETYTSLIVQHTLRARYDEAIQAGREALSLLGVRLPSDDLEAARDAEMAEIQRALAGRDVASLVDLPEMTLPEMKVAMSLLTAMGPPTYRSHTALWSLLCAKAVNLTLRHGNAPQTAYSHTSYGGLLGYVAHDYRAGAAFGDLALRLADRFHNPSDRSVAHMMVGSSLRHWSKHLRHATEDYHKAYTIGLESGNLQYAAYAFGHNMYCRFYQGVNLEQLLVEIAGYLAFSKRRRNQWAIDLLEGGRLVAMNLSGKTAGPADFSSPELSVSEARFVEECRAHRNGQVLCIYHVMKSQVLYLQGQLDAALACAREADRAITSVAPQGLLPSAQHRFIEALILLALAARDGAGAGAQERARAWERIEASQRLLGIWAESCPDNFLHKHLLVSAEMARASGRHADAIDLYDRAIEAALSGQFHQDAALASELAARCWLGRGKERIARHYMLDAYEGYLRWGATAKLQKLEREHPGLLARQGAGSAASPARAARVAVEGTVSADAAWDALDLSAVLRASRALFSEIVLEKLLDTLLRITIENAGAERGYILLPRDGELVIEASSVLGDEAAPGPRGVPLTGTQEICEAVVRSVARTGEALVLDDMSASPDFAADPCVLARRPRSVLCAPTFNHGRLVALVYLENNLSEGCFTAARLEITKILLTQAAIAVDNALLYAGLQRATEEARRANERLEVTVNERTEELREANERLERELVERERAERERAALQEEIIAAQKARIAEMSTPIIPITDDIVVMPVIGTVDAQRAQGVLESALEGAQARRARVLILDITGMRHADSGVAATLASTARALRLLGTEAVLTGVRPELAGALVELGLDLGSITTRGTLQSGIAHALRRSGAAWGTTRKGSAREGAAR